MLQKLKDPYILALIALFVIGIILRFYHFTGFVTYLGDQGRDSIVLYRIATLQDFPGIGASSSVGDLFLGPFFYYFAAPWLLLSGFNPVGPALGVGIFSALMIPIMYFAAKDLFNKKVGIVSAALVTFSFSLVWLSRFAWNPNLLPLMALLTFYFFIKALQDKKWWQFFAAGSFLSMATQMHYASLAFGLPMGLLLLYYIYQNRKDIKNILISIGSLIAGFVVFQAPLLVFELRNNFLNTKGFLGIFGDSRSSGLSGFNEVIYTLNEFNFHALQYRTIDIISIIILVALVAALYIFRNKKDRTIQTVVFFFISMLILTAFFTQNKNRHYFGSLYPLYYLIIGYAIATYAWSKKTLYVGAAFLVGFVLLQNQLTGFFTSPGPHLIRRAENVSQVIFDNADGDSLQITSLPDHYGDYMYRYFMEVWGKRPVDRAGLEKADELFVVCLEECTPIGDPQWDIAYFEPTEVVGTWDVEDVTIYKLIRN